MRHVVAVAREKKIVQTFLKLVVGRRNDVVEPADGIRIVSKASEGKNFHKLLNSDDRWQWGNDARALTWRSRSESGTHCQAALTANPSPMAAALEGFRGMQQLKKTDLHPERGLQ